MQLVHVNPPFIIRERSRSDLTTDCSKKGAYA